MVAFVPHGELGAGDRVLAREGIETCERHLRHHRIRLQPHHARREQLPTTLPKSPGVRDDEARGDLLAVDFLFLVILVNDHRVIPGNARGRVPDLQRAVRHRRQRLELLQKLLLREGLAVFVGVERVLGEVVVPHLFLSGCDGIEQLLGRMHQLILAPFANRGDDTGLGP